MGNLYVHVIHEVLCLEIVNVNVTKYVQENVKKKQIRCYQMCSFKLKMHQNSCWAAAPLRTPLKSLRRLIGLGGSTWEGTPSPSLRLEAFGVSISVLRFSATLQIKFLDTPICIILSSVCLSVCLWRYALWLNDTSYIQQTCLNKRTVNALRGTRFLQRVSKFFPNPLSFSVLARNSFEFVDKFIIHKTQIQ